MAKKGHRRGYASHGFAHEGEDGKKSHKLRVEMQHVDLIMLEHHVEEGGIRLAQRASMKIGTSVAAGAVRVRDSLKLEASIGRTLSMASSLSTRDRPSTGAKDGGVAGRDRGLFPFSACFGAMAMEQAEHKSDWRRETESRGSRGIGEARRRRRGITV